MNQWKLATRIQKTINLNLNNQNAYRNTVNIFKNKTEHFTKDKKIKIKNRNGSQIWSLKRNTFNIFQNTENSFTYWESTMRMKQFKPKKKKKKPKNSSLSESESESKRVTSSFFTRETLPECTARDKPLCSSAPYPLPIFCKSEPKNHHHRPINHITDP